MRCSHLILIIFLGAVVGCGQEAPNYDECKKLLIGMPEGQVVKIMGKPDRIVIRPRTSEAGAIYGGFSSWFYQNPPIMAGQNIIDIDDKTKKIIRIHCSDSAIRKTISGKEVPPNYIEGWRIRREPAGKTPGSKKSDLNTK